MASAATLMGAEQGQRLTRPLFALAAAQLPGRGRTLALVSPVQLGEVQAPAKAIVLFVFKARDLSPAISYT